MYLHGIILQFYCPKWVFGSFFMTLQTLTPTDLPRYGSQVIDVNCFFLGLEFLYSEIILAKLYLFLFSRYGPKCVFYVYGDLDFDLENFDPKKVFYTSLDIPQFKSTIVFCPRYVSKEEFCEKKGGKYKNKNKNNKNKNINDYNIFGNSLKLPNIIRRRSPAITMCLGKIPKYN